MISTAVLVVVAALMLQGAPAGDLIGIGNFSHIVSNLDRSLEFYRDVIGLELNGPVRPFDPNPAIMRLGNTPGAQSRMTALKVNDPEVAKPRMNLSRKTGSPPRTRR